MNNKGKKEANHAPARLATPVQREQYRKGLKKALAMAKEQGLDRLSPDQKAAFVKATMVKVKRKIGIYPSEGFDFEKVHAREAGVPLDTVVWANHGAGGSGGHLPGGVARQANGNNNNNNHNHKQSNVPLHQQEEDEEKQNALENGEDEDMYAAYKAHAIREMHPEVKGHPDPLVETASLRSVPLPKPKFKHGLEEDIKLGRLSDAQVETVIYANMRFMLNERPRPGFFLGDGAGVGKGRQIAALIKQHWLEGGRCVLWVSVSPDLKLDARRDLDDMGADHIPIYGKGDIPAYGYQGVCFITYALLRVGLPKEEKKRPSSDPLEELEESPVPEVLPLVNIPEGSRLFQILDWLRGCPQDCLVIFDESHKAKNLLPTKGSAPTQTGKAVLALQHELPNAKVVYSSATGASEPRNLAYMVRLGMAGVGDTTSVIEVLQQSQLGALELAAMSLKASGAYLARSLSYEGAEFRMTKVKIDPAFRLMYDRSVMVWDLLYRIMGAVGGKRWTTQYWGAHQRFYRSMLMAGKVSTISKMARKAVKNGMAVVIGLQSTGEAGTEQQRLDGGEFDDLISAPRMTLASFVKNYITGTFDAQRVPPESDLQTIHHDSWELARSFKDMVPAKDILAKCDDQDWDDTVEIGGLSSENPKHALTKIEDAISKKRELIRKALMKKASIDLKLIHNRTMGAKNPEDESFKQKQVDLEQEMAAAKKSMEDDTKSLNDLFASRDDLMQTICDMNENAPQNAMNDEHHVSPRKISKYTVATANKPLLNIPDEYAPVRENEGDLKSGLSKQLQDVRKWLLALIEHLELPANPLDSLLENLGGEQHVAELTGRKGYVMKDEYGQAQYRQRKTDNGRQKDINLEEKDAFMSGRKMIAIISDASSTGISLQADRRSRNQRRRYHITLELPWSADKAIQQFGRSHRANQVSAPLYDMVVTPCGGEYRFASAASKRLASLGALLKGDRNALGAGSELKEFDIDNDLGRRSLTTFLNSLIELKAPTGGGGLAKLPELPEDLRLRVQHLIPDGTDNPDHVAFMHYFKYKMIQIGMIESTHTGIMKIEKQVTMTKFLNRLLGLPLVEQEILFQYFSDVMEAERKFMITEGKLEQGILKMEVKADIVEKKCLHRDSSTGASVHQVSFAIDRGFPWEDAIAFYKEMTDIHKDITSIQEINGFYVTKSMRRYVNGEALPYVRLITVVADAEAMAGRVDRMKVKISYPAGDFTNTIPLQDKQMNGYVKVSFQEAERIWKKWYSYTENRCTHGDNCQNFRSFGECHNGSRFSDLHLLCGALLPFWKRIHDLSRQSNRPGRVKHYQNGEGAIKTIRTPLQVVRVLTSEGDPVVGIRAVDKMEMDFFANNLKRSDDRNEDALLRAHGRAYYDAVPGLKKGRFHF